MTVTTTTLGTSPTKRVLEHLRRAASWARDRKGAIAARWRAEIAAGQFGPEAEAIIGRGTGARV
jgi:hypothetical protein